MVIFSFMSNIHGFFRNISKKNSISCQNCHLNDKKTFIILKYVTALTYSSFNSTNTIHFSIAEFFSIAFHAVVSESYPSISQREKVKFGNVKLNTGNRCVSIVHIDLHLAKLIVSKVAAVGNPHLWRI